MAKKEKRSIMAYILVVCMLVGLLPTTAFAEQEQTFICGQEIHTHDESCYTVEGEQKTLTCKKEEHIAHTEECLVEGAKAPQDSEEDTNASESEVKDIEKTDDNKTENTEDKTDEKQAEDTEEKTDDSEKQPENTEDKTDDSEKQPENTEDKTDDSEKQAENTEEKTDDNGQQTGDSQDKADDSEQQTDNTENKADGDEAEQTPAASPINKVIQKKAAAKAAEPAPIAEPHTAHDDVAAADWEAFPSGTTEITGDKSYYLTEPVTLSETLKITGGNVTLCLNGNTLHGGNNERVIQVSGGANFTLCDCKDSQGTGKITGGNTGDGAGINVGGNSHFTMTGGTITDNTGHIGGGVHVAGVFTMTGGTISGNKADSGGAGVLVSGDGTGDNGTFNMSGGTITGNTNTSGDGGGVRVINGTFNMSGGTINGQNTAYNGGGVCVESAGTFNMSGSSTISDNKATSSGGGVYVDGGTFTLKTNGKITGNTAQYGAGVNINSESAEANFIMNGGEISSNNTTGSGAGGGVRLRGDKSTFTMSGGEISGNTVDTGYGGGVCVAGGTFKMTKGTISGNKANNNSDGGGVYINDSTFEMTNGEIINNEAANGGGVCINQNTGAPSFTMSGGEISGNIATDNGGGVCVDGDKGTFTLSGGSVKDNTASGETNNVYLPSGISITIYGTLSGEEQVGVTTEDALPGATIATGAKSKSDATYFFSDKSKETYKPAFDETNNNVVLVERQPVTVTFDANGGTIDGDDDGIVIVNAEKDELLPKADIPTVTAPTGMFFVGWYDNADGSGEAFDFETTEIPSDKGDSITFYAKWSNKPVVTFNYNDDGVTPDGEVEANADGTVTKPADPTRTGYTFVGWYAEGSDTAFDFKTTITNSLTLVAKWSNKPVVTFNYNDNGVTPDKKVEVNADGTVTKPADPTKTGYTFVGWYAEGSATAFDFTEVIKENITLIAKWKSKITISVPGMNKLSISGTVKYDDTGEPAANASISIERSSSIIRVLATTTTDSQGRYTLNGSFNPGSYTICAKDTLADGVVEEGSTKITLAKENITNADITIAAKNRVEFDLPPGFIILGGREEIKDHVTTEDDTTLTFTVDEPANEIKDKIESVVDKDMRNKLGAMQNKLEHTMNNLNITTMDITAEESRIKDIDNAKEKMAYTKNPMLLKHPIEHGIVNNWDSEILDNWDSILIDRYKENESGEIEHDKTLDRVRRPGSTNAPGPARALSAEPDQLEEDTYWIDEDGIHICFRKMGYYAIVTWEESDEPQKETSKRPSGGGRGRTGTWVKAEAEPEQKTEDIQQNEPIPNNQNVQPRNDANCLKDSSCPLSKFVDVNLNEWYHDGLHYCVENGLMAGTSANLLEPNKNATRAMVVTILWRLENSPVVDTEISFDDVVDGSYYKNAVVWAVKNGIVSGYDEKTFAPEGNITREQMAAILYRYSQYKGKDVTAQSELNFADANEVSDYAVTAMQWACATGIVNGTSSTMLSPQGNTTRAQLAQMLKVYINM